MRSPKTYNPDLLHPELSHGIIGAAFDVHNELGPGWNEWDYHRAMLEALQKRNIQAESHLRKKLIHRNEGVDQFELDILVENKVILELKHIRTGFSDQNYTQIINYLKCWKKDLGILINFGMERLYYKRVPYTPTIGTLAFSGLWNTLQSTHPEISERVVSATQNILNVQGLGYGAESSQKIVFQEFIHQNLAPKTPKATPTFNGRSFEPRLLSCIFIENEILSSVTAFRDTTATDVARLQSGMKQLAIPFGILMNFGKTELTLRGVQIRLSHS
jgi:GxxExxY protein